MVYVTRRLHSEPPVVSVIGILRQLTVSPCAVALGNDGICALTTAPFGRTVAATLWGAAS